MADKKSSLLTARRRARVRGKITGTTDKPRLNVFVSNAAIEAQIIDDASGKTLAHSRVSAEKMTKLAAAEKVGTDIATAAKKAKVKTVVFDRGAKRYHGRVAAVADAARKAGLEF